MKERERAQDRALVALLHGVGLLVSDTGSPVATAIGDAMVALQEASARQHDEDRNGVRRSMGKGDCPEKEEDECGIRDMVGCHVCANEECEKRGKPYTLTHCPQVRAACDKCDHGEACLVSLRVVGDVRAHQHQEEESATGA